MEIVKYAWVQAGFIGLLIVLGASVIIAGWKIISTLWTSLNEIRKQRDEDFRKSIVANELSAQVGEKMAAAIKEQSELIKILISKSRE